MNLIYDWYNILEMSSSYLTEKGSEFRLERSILSIKFVTTGLFAMELSSFNLLKVFNRLSFFNDDNLTFVIPFWIDLPSGNYDSIKIDGFPEGDIKSWLISLWNVEREYKKLKTLKWPAEKLLSIIPYNIKSTMVLTSNYPEWRRIFKTALSDSNDKMCTQTRQLLTSVLFEVSNKLPYVFNDLTI